MKFSVRVDCVWAVQVFDYDLRNSQRGHRHVHGGFGWSCRKYFGSPKPEENPVANFKTEQNIQLFTLCTTVWEETCISTWTISIWLPSCDRTNGSKENEWLFVPSALITLSLYLHFIYCISNIWYKRIKINLYHCLRMVTTDSYRPPRPPPSQLRQS